MPLAVTHVLLTIILLDLFRDYVVKDKKKIPLHFVFIGGIAGLVADIDVPLYWLLNALGFKVVWFHGSITHTVLWPLLAFLISLFFLKVNRKIAALFSIVSFGLLFHVFLDFLLHGTIKPFWPFSSFTIAGIMGGIDLPLWNAGLDAIILLAWLWHEEKRHKISDFI